MRGSFLVPREKGESKFVDPANTVKNLSQIAPKITIGDKIKSLLLVVICCGKIGASKLCECFDYSAAKLLLNGVGHTVSNQVIMQTRVSCVSDVWDIADYLGAAYNDRVSLDD